MKTLSKKYSVTVVFIFLIILNLWGSALPASSLVTEAPSIQWSKTFGGTNFDEASWVIQTNDGGYVIVGSTESSVNGYDFWLVKTDSEGNQLWNQTFGGVDNDGARCVVQTGDGGYVVVGYTESFGAGAFDFWVIKTDENGNHLWNQTYGGIGYDTGVFIIQTSDGGYALAGNSGSFGAGNIDFWVIKTDENGTPQWNQTYGGTGDDEAKCIIQTDDGGYFITGYANSFGAGNIDFWVIKTDENGTHLWNQTYGGAGSDPAFSMTSASDEGYTMAGYTSSAGTGGFDFWLVKVDPAGNQLWNKTFGGLESDTCMSLTKTIDGGYALLGSTRSFGAGDFDFWLVKTDSMGNQLWNQTYGGTNVDRGYCIIQTGDGGYALAGGTESFGEGMSDFWLIKLFPEAMQVAAPTFSPEGGLYTLSQNVTINCITPEATIRYTTDNSEPTNDSTEYSTPIVITTNTTLKAKAFKNGMNASDTTSATFSIIEGILKVSTPTFNPTGGHYSTGQYVTIQSNTSDAIIHYTLDGSEPSSNSTTYIDPVFISSNTTIRAIAFKTGLTESEIATMSFSFDALPNTNLSFDPLIILAIVILFVFVIIGVLLLLKRHN